MAYYLRKKNLMKWLVVVILVAFSTAISAFLGDDNRNFLLIGLMGLSPVLLLIFYRKVYLTEVILLLFLCSIIILPLVFNPQSLRWSTVLYSWMFGLTYILFRALLFNHVLNISEYKKLLRYLIYSFFGVLVVQQLSVLTGLPIINESNYRPADPWKLNSISVEPSNAAKTLAILFYSYMTVSQLAMKRSYDLFGKDQRDIILWFAFLWAALTMRSSTMFVFLPFILATVVNFKNVTSLIFAVLGGLAVLSALGITEYERVYTLTIAVLSLDVSEVLRADHSGSLRIAPMMVLLPMVDIFSIEGLFGHGVDTVKSFMSYYIPGVPKNYAGGGLVRLWYEYGFLSFLLFVGFSMSCCFSKRNPSGLVFWVLLVFMAGVNNQIVWLSVSLLTVNRYFVYRNIDVKSKKSHLGANQKSLETIM